MPYLADRLASFVRRTRYEDLPPTVVADAKARLLDSIGLAFASSGQPFAKPMLELARGWYGSGRCTALGLARGLSAPAAGLVNATLIHGQDLDDTHTETLVHPTACVAPAAFALAEAHGLTGRELVRLFALGHEVDVRLGLGASPGGQIDRRGFHQTSVSGAVAAAAMTALAMGADQEPTRRAIALSTSVAAGLTESKQDGSFAKGIQPGWAVQGGMWAATAAITAGITGFREAFEGRFGYYQAFAGLEHCHLDLVTAGLGETWRSLDTDFKLYPLAHHMQGPADSALSIRKEARISDPDQVAAIESIVCEEQVMKILEPLEECLAPSNEYSMKFNLRYSVAIGLAYGSYRPEDFTAALSDPKVKSLAARLTYRAVKTGNVPKRLPGALKVTLRDGRVLERAWPHPPGPFGRPLGPSELEEKFRGNSVRVLSGPDIKRVIEKMRTIEDGSLEFVGALLCP